MVNTSQWIQGALNHRRSDLERGVSYENQGLKQLLLNNFFFIEAVFLLYEKHRLQNGREKWSDEEK